MYCRTGLTAIALTLALSTTATAQEPCPCDCDGNGSVGVSELVRAVNIALGQADITTCMAADSSGDGEVAVNELIRGVNAALDGCDAATRTPTPTAPTSTPTPDEPTSTPVTGQLPPTDSAELVPWLQAGAYLGWTSESAIHVSGGPHPSAVLTYFNDTLIASLQAGNAAHPVDSATVKELYNNSGEINGWAVSVKTQADSASGDGWYWYERVGNSVFADGNGVGLCANCHGTTTSGFTSKDYILAPFPLQ